jgi:hypothetical protein
MVQGTHQHQQCGQPYAEAHDDAHIRFARGQRRCGGREHQWAPQGKDSAMPMTAWRPERT